MGKGEEIPKTNPAEIEAVIARVKQSNIEQRDVELIERLLRTVLVLVKLLERKNISIKKLREMVFGRRTEKRRKAGGAIGEKSGETGGAEEEERREERGEAGNVERSSSKSAERQVSGGHGHRAAATYPDAKIVSIDRIPITDQKAWGGVFRKRLDQLLGCPRGGRMFRDVEMNDLTSFMR